MTTFVFAPTRMVMLSTRFCFAPTSSSPSRRSTRLGDALSRRSSGTLPPAETSVTRTWLSFSASVSVT